MQNPTQQALRKFFGAKKELLETFSNLLETQGYMGYSMIDSLPTEDLPPTIKNLILKIKTGSVNDVLTAIKQLDYSEAVHLNDKVLRTIQKLPSQCITRSHSGYDFVVRILKEPEVFKALYGRKPTLLSKLPKDWQPIDYARASEYGGFLLALYEGNLKQFRTYVEKLTPICLTN